MLHQHVTQDHYLRDSLFKFFEDSSQVQLKITFKNQMEKIFNAFTGGCSERTTRIGFIY